MDYIPRKLEIELSTYLNNAAPPYNTILLAGARQCGKSTLLNHLFPPAEHIHVNLALRGDLCEAIDKTSCFDDLTFLLQSQLEFKAGEGDRVLIIDEAQFSKKLGGYVRFFKEQWQRQKVILTGSTLSSLFDDHPKPTGRVVEFVLRPFNFIEFLHALGQHELIARLEAWQVTHPFSETVHHRAIELLQSYLTVGGLPEVVMAYKDKSDHLRILANIFAFYRRDFENKAGEKLTALFTQAFLRIAAATGSPIKNSSIVKSSSPGYKKVQDVLALLEDWHQVIKVETETASLSKTGTMTPKRYLFDHGIRYLQNPSRFSDIHLLDSQDISREDIGGIIENFALTEMLSLNTALSPRSWAKTNQSGLVDFILPTGRKPFAIEVKAALSFNQKHTASLKAYHQKDPQAVTLLANLSQGQTYRGNDCKITVVPVYALYSFLKSWRETPSQLVTDTHAL